MAKKTWMKKKAAAESEKKDGKSAMHFADKPKDEGGKKAKKTSPLHDNPRSAKKD